MTYLLIAFVLLVILSPLMWFRQSPRQNLMINMRKEATRLGLIVSLSAPPDARQGKRDWIALPIDCRGYLIHHDHKNPEWRTGC